MRYLHTRSAWVGDRPVSGPAFDWNRIDFVVVHWPGHDGVPDGDIGESTDIARYICNTHHGYLSNRGYSLGYSSAVDYLSGTWEIRGDTFRAASNAGGGGEFNARTFSIWYLTDLDGNTTSQGIAGVNDLIGQVRARRPNVKVIGHRDGTSIYSDATATSCPSNPIYTLVHNGTIGAPPLEEDDMATPDEIWAHPIKNWDANTMQAASAVLGFAHLEALQAKETAAQALAAVKQLQASGGGTVNIDAIATAVADKLAKRLVT
jgi:hypothetical protein